MTDLYHVASKRDEESCHNVRVIGIFDVSFHMSVTIWTSFQDNVS